jgi:hypothetical protein
LTHFTRTVSALLLCVPVAGAALADGWLGAKACGECHPSEEARQSGGAHARSLYRAQDHPLAARFAPPAPVWREKYRFALQNTGGDLRFRADDGKYVTELPVEWAFGAGIYAVTFLSKVAPDLYLELAFSYYSDTRTLDLTPRHDTLPGRTLHESMGQAIRTRTAGVQCFGCHSTGGATVSDTGEVQPRETGVRCEACHGPGRAHRQAVRDGNTAQAKRLIKNPGTLSAGAINEFCGECHRVARNLTDADWNSPWSYRHQPPYLARSRCFQKGAGKLSCLTCHDPHGMNRPADAGFYRSRCVACHSAAHRQDADCTACHMPLVRASSHLSFRNHQIGIYR